MKRRKYFRRLSSIAIESLETRIALATDVVLNIFVDSEQVTIPADIGVDSGGTALSDVVSTSANGDISVEDDSLSVTLGQFFDTWRTNAGVAGNDADATLSETELLGNTVNSTDTLQMFVNGELSSDFDDYVLQDQDRIVLVYGDNPVVSLNTTFGPLVFDLFESEAPQTIDNFLNYFNRGDFVGSFFHRSVDDFVIQGGGFATTSTTFTSVEQFSRIDTDPPVVNEPGRSNLRGTVAMAKTSDPNSATNQFFVNLSDDNTFLDNPSNSGGFTVFAQILDIGVADAINDLPINNDNGSPYGELPLAADGTLVVIESVVGQGVITGVKFNDANADGLFDSTENPVSGATVFVDANENGALDTGEVTAVTDVNGRYRLQVVPGTYSIGSVLNDGFVATSSFDAVSVETGREFADADLGEVGLQVVDDTLTAFNNVPTTTFDVLANDSLPAGSSLSAVTQGTQGGTVAIVGDEVSYTIPTGFVGADTFTYSIEDPTGRTLTATATVTVTDNNSGSVSGVVYLDGDESGTQDAGEIGVPGSMITLTGTDDSGGTVSLTEISANDGTYMFASVPPGSYTLSQTQPEALINGQRLNANDEPEPDSNEIADIVVTEGEDVSGNDFSESRLEVEYASIVWFFASSDEPAEAFREAVAIGEETAGNMELASMIRASSTEGSPDDPTDPVENPLTIISDNYEVVEGGTLTVVAADGVLANDLDPLGGDLTAVVETQPGDGIVTLNSDGGFTYLPNADFSGTDSFVYRASNGTIDATGTATIVVTGVNDPPIAVNDTLQTNEDTPLTLAAADGLLANDTDADGDILVASVLVDPAAGNVTVANDGSLNYIPDSNFAGTDTFTYEVSDGTATSAATVVINVRPVNDPPTAEPDSYVTAQNQALEVKAEDGLLVNDSDVEANPLTAVLIEAPSNGQVDLNADGSFVYIPVTGFTGTDTFIYAADDGSDESVSNVVTLVVEESVGFGEAYSVNEDTTLSIPETQGVLVNDLADSTEALTAMVTTPPRSGTFTLNPNGSFEYVPLPEFSGVLRFDYDVLDDTDAVVESSTATINVIAVNDAPVGVADSYDAIEDEVLTVSIADGLLANDSDAEGDALTVALGTLPTKGTLVLNPNGSFQYTPNENENGTDTFTYSLSDGTVTAVISGTIEIQALNDRPDTLPDAYMATPGVPLVVSAADGVLANDSDAEGDSLSVTLDSNGQQGTVLLQSNGGFTYTPDSSFTGTDTFSYEAFDGLDVARETVTITANAPNMFTASATASDGEVLGRIAPATAFNAPMLFQIADNTLEDELVLAADDHISGAATAPVVLIEYLDFQCPSCAAYHPIVSDLEDAFDGDLLVVRRHLPLESIHPNARAAALASEAAANQGQFEAMGDLLFGRQNDWASLPDPTATFEAYATELGLNLTEFRADVANADIDAGITADFDAAVDLGATGTPTFFLAGERITNPASEAEFEGLIQSEIAAIDEVFAVDRITGDVIVLDASLLTPSSTETLPVLVSDLSSSETVDVSIEVGELTGGGTSSSLAADAALATEDDWLAVA